MKGSRKGESEAIEMAQVNLLEEILSEWFEFKGYFVKRNVRVGLLEKGGRFGLEYADAHR